ncbi:Gfo/Idh/MocA family protein [Peribacillus kribbensis]|uniref:Gfo/Idh/MocA family protein n=1 Tax=Peribacillus kribbensis TaxID=356658 RepID=UPI0004236AC2|nr:Gfo/Idh/MocA family oxidoreductase [Peribacillus kribbensis]
MLKIGIIGLGDIAQKAYLPIFSRIEDAEFHLYTRNQEKLKNLGNQYRWSHLHESLDSLLEAGIKGAFVHTSTDSHKEIVTRLLHKGIHVFVDKPITADYESSKKLVELAREKNLMLTVGFNRRFAPPYQFVRETPELNMVLMQKNRSSLPDSPRRFIFDDFIHVVDTIRHLYPYDFNETIITGKMISNKLFHVTMQLVSDEGTAIGIMNRDSGTTEERLEAFGSEGKRIALNVNENVLIQEKNETKLGGNDWEETLSKRGFRTMIQNFIDFLTGKAEIYITPEDALMTHWLCEQAVQKFEKRNVEHSAGIK